MGLPLTDRAANRGRLPNKLLDYMAAGRPTVASPVGDIKTILEEHEVGLLAGDEAISPRPSRPAGQPGTHEPSWGATPGASPKKPSTGID